MATATQHTVVILYEHALLGEGIAKYLRTQLGVEATLGSARDPRAVTSALALGPHVVIYESNDPARRFDLTGLAPNVVLIDLSKVITRGPAITPTVAGLEQIMQAVRESSCGTVDHSTLKDSTIADSPIEDSTVEDITVDHTTALDGSFPRLADVFHVAAPAPCTVEI